MGELGPRHLHILLPGPEMRDRLWHAAYCRWYDHRQVGHVRRASVWGWVADLLCVKEAR